MKIADDDQSTRPAFATIHSTSGNLLGDVVFIPGSDGLSITAKLTGLESNKEYGFNIHENGECVGSLESAGGHFNPTNYQHGAPGPESHYGDLGSLKTDETGNADFNYVSKELKLNSTNDGVIGRSLIIDKGGDDAGSRIACGIIRYKNK